VNPSRPFILRPVATSLLMAAIMLIGIVGYTQLPVSALPEVDYPTIQVVTFYPGASPDVMATTVTAPLERQFGEMQGLSQMTSTSSGATSVIVLQFNLSLQMDIAEEEVQAAINAAQSYLPSNLPAPPIYNKTNPADAPVLTLAVTSKTMPLSHVEDMVDTRLVPKISQLSGVGLVGISGGQKPAVRIQANPAQLQSYGIDMEALRTALTQASVNAAKGNFDGPKKDYQIDANDQLVTSGDYQDRRCLSEQCAGLAERRGKRNQRGREHEASGLDERNAGGDCEYPAPAGGEHHQRSQKHYQADAATEGNPSCRDRRHHADRSDHRHQGFQRPSRGSRTCGGKSGMRYAPPNTTRRSAQPTWRLRG
jgi:hypothetical protein